MKSKISMILILIGLALGGFSSAFGSSSFTTSFNNANGTSYGCNLCHISTSAPNYTRNQFGLDWANASIGNRSYTITTALANRDSDGDGYFNGDEILAKTNPGDAASFPTGGTADTTLPVVSVFTIPSSSSSLVVPISAIAATDNVGVTGYLVNESPTKPAAGNWPAAAPTSYTFSSAGAKTLYAWARDAAGNVSNVLSSGRSVSITLADATLPVVSAFIVPATSATLVVPITTFTATDNVGVTGYLVNESATKPAAGNWPATAPTSYTFAGTGAKTLYAWARDAAGNVSNSLSGTVTIDTGSAIDVESPEVMEFTLPLTSTSLTVPILAFRAIDNIDAVAYLITTTPTEPAANAQGWRATPPRAIPLLPGARRHFTAGPRTRPGTSRKVSGTTWS